MSDNQAKNSNDRSSNVEEESFSVNQSTPSLQQHLQSLRSKSAFLSQTLTQILASSPSGQNLLFLAPALSTLPPDLYSLKDNLRPLLDGVLSYQEENEKLLEFLREKESDILELDRRREESLTCAELWIDLESAECNVARELNSKEQGIESLDELDHLVLLERATHITLCLVQELKASAAEVSALTFSPSKIVDDSPKKNTEKAQFLLKLAPRIRRLEGDTVKCLVSRLETLLTSLKQQQQPTDLLKIGTTLRALSLLGRGPEAESTFARVAIMPLIRQKLSMGRLDEGGIRGECAGLFSFLEDLSCSVERVFGAVVRLGEGMFGNEGDDSVVEVDLVTAGVWVPIATALVTDPGIRMAIFSPGIASVLQANYVALETFLSELAYNLLKPPPPINRFEPMAPGYLETDFASFYYNPTPSSLSIQAAQSRIYQHSMTSDFFKKWNLPIYYQLRFGEACTRLNKAVKSVQAEGWNSNVFTGSVAMESELRNTQGFELPLFLELYDTLLWFWRADVLLKPLTHRFLRGAIQLLGRVVVFVKEGLEGKVRFDSHNGNTRNGIEQEFIANTVVPSSTEDNTYSWGDNIQDVASVAWELTVLETCIHNDYLETIMTAVAPQVDLVKDSFRISKTELEDMRAAASGVLLEASEDIAPIIYESWNQGIVNVLTSKCSMPLSAVKGVAATYRMTNRPPPTQASPFVGTILRSLKEFDDLFSSRTPPQVGTAWKESVVNTVADRYSAAVEELIETVQKTEEALKNRKARRAAVGGMSDGEKVKLQLYLDYMEFGRKVAEVGIDPSAVNGIVKLGTLTEETESLYSQSQNGDR